LIRSARQTALALAFAILSAGAEGAQSGFVKVNGTHFELDGNPYYFTGTNLWYGAYLGAPGPGGDRARLARELDDLAKLGIDNLRVLAISEQSSLERAVRPGMLDRNGRIDEALLQGLDFLLDEMAKRDMKAVLYLTNFWQWSGGMSQYVSWSDGKPPIDPDATGRWNDFMENSARLYTDDQANTRLRAAIRKVLTRRNTINGRDYSADPTIMAWQLANEPRPGSDVGAQANAKAYSRWIDETAGYIRRLAPKQLVSSGSEGSMGSGRDLALYKSAHSTRNIDYLTAHMWAPNWQWFDPKRAAETHDAAWKRMSEYLETHFAAATQLGKPLVLEEFGINRDDGAFEPTATLVYRDRFYTAIFAVLEKNAAAGGPLAGSNFWAWNGKGRARNADFMWKPGDPFVGDPPQEPQGLYGVFDTDTSTIAIIAAHATRMRALKDHSGGL
jgi:mannan endo-1,4-beta-mannosidase